MNKRNILKQYKVVLRALDNNILAEKVDVVGATSQPGKVGKLLWTKSPMYPLLIEKFRSQTENEQLGNIHQLSRYTCLLQSVARSKELIDKYQAQTGSTVKASAARVGLQLPKKWVDPNA